MKWIARQARGGWRGGAGRVIPWAIENARKEWIVGFFFFGMGKFRERILKNLKRMRMVDEGANEGSEKKWYEWQNEYLAK